MEPDGLLEKQYFQRTCSTVQGKIIIHDIPCITFLPYKALGWVQLEPKSDCATLRSWLMEHTKESHQFCLCHLAKWCYAWISFPPCWANTPAVHNNPLCTQQTFSTSSGPGSGPKNTHEEFPNILTTTDMLTRADFVALDGPFTKKKKNHFIAFLFQVPLRLSHSSVQKFQSHPCWHEHATHF